MGKERIVKLSDFLQAQHGQILDNEQPTLTCTQGRIEGSDEVGELLVKDEIGKSESRQVDG